MNPAKGKLRKIILIVLAVIFVPIILFVIIVLSISGPAGFRSIYNGLTDKPTGDLEQIIIARDEVSRQLNMGMPLPENQYERNTTYASSFYDAKQLERDGATGIYYYALTKSVVTTSNAEKLTQNGWDVHKGNLDNEQKSLSATRGCVQITLTETMIDKYTSAEEAAFIKRYASEFILTDMYLRAYKKCSK